MSARLFLGHLSPRVQERDVEDFFRGYGKIRDIVLKNGFGFVELEDARDAQDAVRHLDGKNLCDSRTTVEFASQRGGSRGGGGGFSNSRDRSFGGSSGFSNSRDRSFGGGYRESSRSFGGDKRDRSPVLSRYRYRLIIENLTTRCDWQELKNIFADCYPVFADAHKKERNIGIVCFDSQSDLKRALEKYQGKDLNGRQIRLVDDTQQSRAAIRSPVRRGRSFSLSPRKGSARKRSSSRSVSHSNSVRSPLGSPVKSDSSKKRLHSRSSGRSNSVKSPRGSIKNVGRKRSRSRSSDRSNSEKSPRGSPVNTKRLRSLSRSRSSGRSRRSHSKGSDGGRDRRRA